MHILKVGQLYNPTIRRWPECAQFGARGGIWELLLFLADPSPVECAGVTSGQAELAVLVRGPVLFLLYRFGDAGAAIPWGDAPTTIHLTTEAERQLPPEPKTPETRGVLRVLLVDAATGILRGMRALSLSHEVSEALYGATIAQAAQPWDRAAYDGAVAAAYREFPGSDAMAAAARVRCVGGA